MPPRAMVTGAGSGLGRATALTLAGDAKALRAGSIVQAALPKGDREDAVALKSVAKAFTLLGTRRGAGRFVDTQLGETLRARRLNRSRYEQRFRYF